MEFYNANLFHSYPTSNYRYENMDGPYHWRQGSFHEDPIYYEEDDYYSQEPYQGYPQRQDEPSILSLVAQLVATQAQQQATQAQQQIIQAQLQKDSQLILKQLDQMEAHNKRLETQIAQQASSSSRYEGKLPSQPDVNSIEMINAITLKSGRVLDEPQPRINSSKSNVVVEKGESSKDKEDEEQKDKYQEPPPYIPPIPFPQRQRKKKEDAHFKRFAEMLKKLQVTIPFTEVITQVPTYANFLKDIISRKREVHEIDHVALDANCSDIIQHNMPRKLSDHGSFSIPISIGDVNISNALCDLGASISLMPYSLFQKLDMGELTPTSIRLRLADRSSRSPKGILEDVPIKVGKFYVPVDFYVLEMDEVHETPIILGRPFLNTVKAVIDCGDGTMELNLGSEKIKFNMVKTLSAPNSSKDCHMIDTYDMNYVFDSCGELTSFELELLNQEECSLSFTSLMELEEEASKEISFKDKIDPKDIILNHFVSMRELELDKDAIKVFEKIPPTKDVMDAIEEIKKALVISPIIYPPNRDPPFTMMCNTIDNAIEPTLYQRFDKRLHDVYDKGKGLDGRIKAHLPRLKQSLEIDEIKLYDHD